MLNGRFRKHQNMRQMNDKKSKTFFLLDVIEIPRGTSNCKSSLDFDVDFCILIYLCDDALFKILIRPKHTVVLSFMLSADILFSIIFIFLSWEFSHVSETEIQVCILVSSVYCSIMVNLWVQLELSLFVIN